MYKINKKDIVLLQQHNEFAFLRIRKQYINPLCFFLSNEFNLSNAEIEDLANDIFMKAAYFKIHLYDPDKGSFSTWLFTLAKNYCIDYLKNNVNLSYLHVNNQDLENIAYTQDNYNIFCDIKKFLTEDEFNYLIDYFVYEMTIVEIAKKYSVNKRTVCRKLKNAKRLIKLHRDDLSI